MQYERTCTTWQTSFLFRDVHTSLSRIKHAVTMHEWLDPNESLYRNGHCCCSTVQYSTSTVRTVQYVYNTVKKILYIVQ